MSNIFLNSTVEDVLETSLYIMGQPEHAVSEGICKLGIIFSHDKQFYVPCSIFVTF
jgi:hypothetical protein